jgi:hypothetical protein
MEVILATTGSWPYTRNMDQALTRQYKLPANIKLESLTRYPGVQGGGSQLLLSAANGNNSFIPVVLDLQQNSGKIYIGDPIQATALIPFWTIISGKDTGTTKYVRTGGYAVVRADNGQTELCLWNQTTMSLDEPFATFPNSARSVNHARPRYRDDENLCIVRRLSERQTDLCLRLSEKGLAAGYRQLSLFGNCSRTIKTLHFLYHPQPSRTTLATLQTDNYLCDKALSVPLHSLVVEHPFTPIGKYLHS